MDCRRRNEHNSTKCTIQLTTQYSTDRYFNQPRKWGDCYSIKGSLTGKRKQWLSFLEANILLTQGHNIKLTYEHFDPDTDTNEDERNQPTTKSYKEHEKDLEALSKENIGPYE